MQQPWRIRFRLSTVTILKSWSNGYYGRTLPKQNRMHEKIKSRWISGNAHYRSL